jgi:acetyl-CoA acetyltransferase
VSWITGIGLTAFGKHPGRGTLDLMSEAAAAALADARLERREVDGLLTGYSTTFPHLMLATVFAEHFGLKPSYAHAVQVGGATGFAMIMLAHHLVESGAARRVLVVAGENRLTGQTRDAAVQTLAQVGHPENEVPLGATIPAYYGLVASRWIHERIGAAMAPADRARHDAGAPQPEDGTVHWQRELAELAVLMRRHAALHSGAQFRDPITVDEVMASKPVASPLKLLDCCPVSDGGAAFVVGRERGDGHAVRIAGTGQAHTHQHISAAPSLVRYGAAESMARASAAARFGAHDCHYAAIYDSFTITLAILLEELGLAPPGRSGRCAREGEFSRGGRLPLNTHGGLLSYGHCGVGGAMAHLAEAHLQLTGRAGARQCGSPGKAVAHGDGGVLSSHVSLLLAREDS